MSLRPWMTRRFLVALMAMGVLFVLLVVACLRLLSSEYELNDYVTEDMVWHSSQSQYEAVRFAVALGAYRDGEISLPDLQLRLDLLSSRIAVLEKGEPNRQLEALGFAQQLRDFRTAVDAASATLLTLQPQDVTIIARLRDQASVLGADMRNVANAALFSRRERDVNSRLHRHQTLIQVLTTLVATMLAGLLMAAILVRDHRNMVDTQSALERERQVSRLHRAFISIVSHQFRTPLAIIDASAQRMIRRGAQMSQAEIHSRADKIRAACLRLTRLMESTLNSARLEEGEITINLRPCDIGELLRTVIASQPDADKRRLRLQTLNLPRLIHADTTLLEQAVQNLVSNGLKYSPADQPVMIFAQTLGNDLVISVTDNGVGIPADELGSLFQRFFRARTAEGIPGTGIGLSFVEQIVQLHGGRVDVKSTQGQGATFTLRFPCRQPHPAVDGTARRTASLGARS